MGERDGSNDGMHVVITDGVDDDIREGIVVEGKVELNDEGDTVDGIELGHNDGQEGDGSIDVLSEGKINGGIDVRKDGLEVGSTDGKTKGYSDGDNEGVVVG